MTAGTGGDVNPAITRPPGDRKGCGAAYNCRNCVHETRVPRRPDVDTINVFLAGPRGRTDERSGRPWLRGRWPADQTALPDPLSKRSLVSRHLSGARVPVGRETRPGGRAATGGLCFLCDEKASSWRLPVFSCSLFVPPNTVLRPADQVPRNEHFPEQGSHDALSRSARGHGGRGRGIR